MEIAKILLSNLFRITLITSVLIVIIMTLRAILSNKMSSKVYYFLWVLVVIRSLFIFNISSPISIENIFLSFSVEDNIETKSLDYINTNQINTDISYEINESKGLNINSDEDSNKLVINIIFCIYLLGLLVTMLIPIVSYFVLQLDLKKDEFLDIDSNLITLNRKILYDFGITKSINIKLTDMVTTPGLIGVFNPIILLPPSYNSLDSEKVYQILLHEIIHYKKKHVLLQWIFWIGKSIHWFNPLIWIAHKCMKEDAEIWCDEEVINIIGNNERETYGNLIIDISSDISEPIYKLSAIGFNHRMSEIKKRITSIAKESNYSKPIKTFIIILIVILIPCLFTIKNIKINSNSSKEMIENLSGEIVSEIKPLEENMLEIKPINYSYNKNDGTITVELFCEKKGLLKEYENEYFDISIGGVILFPASKDPEIRDKDIYGGGNLSQYEDTVLLTFEIDDYNYNEYGKAKLVIEYGMFSVCDERTIIMGKNEENKIVQIEPWVILDIQNIRYNKDENQFIFDVVSENDDSLYISPRIDLSDEMNIKTNGSSISGEGDNGKSLSRYEFNVDNDFEIIYPIELELIDLDINIGRYQSHYNTDLYWRFDID